MEGDTKIQKNKKIQEKRLPENGTLHTIDLVICGMSQRQIVCRYHFPAAAFLNLYFASPVRE